MKICLISRAPFHAGAEVALERLAIGLRDAGYKVVVILGGQGITFDRIRAAAIGCRVIPQAFTDKWRWWRYQSARRNLIRVLREEKPDLIHSNDLPTHQMASDAAQRLGVPRICHHRWVYSGGAIDWLNKFGAERHIFVSSALKTEMCAQSERLRMSRTQVIHDGLALPPRPDSGSQTRARHELGLAPDRAILLYAGQIIERKGIVDLLQAWALLNVWHARAELIIVGDDLENKGRYRDAMQTFSRAIGAPARFVGFQSNVHSWQMAADVAIVPSHVEPLGLVTLEAMARCVPVIGSRVGGIPEVITDGETGVLVPSGSPVEIAAAVDRLLSDPLERTRMGNAGRIRCERHFSMKAHVAQVVRLYEQVVSERWATVRDCAARR